LLPACSSQNRERQRGECGRKDSCFEVDGLSKPAIGLLFPVFFFFVCACLLVSVSTETLPSHASRSTSLTLVIEDDYGSSAVLAVPGIG